MSGDGTPEITLNEAQRIVASKTAPRVTEDSIKEKIMDVQYILEDTTTICLIRMKNGFKFVGTSTPASAENYDGKVGERYAYDNAFRQIWTHEGYLLRERLSTEQNSAPAASG